MNDAHVKDFNTWNDVKKKIELRKNLPLFKEREIWWCGIGMNIGFEIFGKGQEFYRPVLVLDKHNRHTFFGLPLGSARKENSIHHYPLEPVYDLARAQAKKVFFEKCSAVYLK